MKKLKEKGISRKYYFKGKLLKFRVDLVKLPSGKTTTREMVEHPGAVAIIALTKKNRLVLIKQYRQATGKVMLEVPAGCLHQGETPMETASRELEEETGYQAKKFKKLISSYVSPGYSTELIHYLLAEELAKVKPIPEEDENIKVVEIPLKKCGELVKKGKIEDNKTIIGILLAESHGKRNPRFPRIP